MSINEQKNYNPPLGFLPGLPGFANSAAERTAVAESKAMRWPDFNCSITKKAEVINYLDEFEKWS